MSQSPTQLAIRRAYGRGFHDALKQQQTQEIAEVNNTRMAQAIDTLNAQSRKVYEAVPILEEWTPSQVSGELARQGLAHQPRVVLGILASLVRTGLVRESKPGLFSKLPVRRELTPKAKPEKTTAPEPATQLPATLAAVPKPDDTLTKIALLSNQVRDAANDLLALATGLDDVAIAVEERISKIDADSATLRQLQTLLKNIGVGA